MYSNNGKEIETKINKEISNCKMAYEIMDEDGNTFFFSGLENGFPSYRTMGGSKHIFDLQGYKVIQKFCKL